MELNVIELNPDSSAFYAIQSGNRLGLLYMYRDLYRAKYGVRPATLKIHT